MAQIAPFFVLLKFFHKRGYMEKEFVLLPKRSCPKCGRVVAFLEDLPGAWYGYCAGCRLLLKISARLNGEVQIAQKKSALEEG